jgi:hypothetical protein
VGERVSAGDGVDGGDSRQNRKRGEELAKMSAASFALVLSLPVSSAALLFPSLTT